MMRVGIHKDPYGAFNRFYERYEAILDHNGIEHVRLEASDADFWDELRGLDLLIFRWGHFDTDRQKARSILPVVEHEMRLRCFPDWRTCWHYDDKIKQYYLMKQHGFPMVESYVFWEKEHALNWAKRASYPVVFKLKGGAASANVILVPNEHRAQRLIKRMFGRGIHPDNFFDPNHLRFRRLSPRRELKRIGRILHKRWLGQDVTPYWQVQKNYALFQEFLPNNAYDTRITVIGGRAFGFRRFVREGDFRSSGSGKIDYDPQQIDLEFVRQAFEISRRLQFQSMAYDFLYGPEGTRQFCEISYTYMDAAIHNCPGYWDEQLNWQEGHYWPQFYHLIDALGLPDMTQPEMQ